MFSSPPALAARPEFIEVTQFQAAPVHASESLCVWVGLDGSTWYANTGHNAVSSWSSSVTQNARYAMWYDRTGAKGGRMQSAYDGCGNSPAIDVFLGDDIRTSNGTTSTTWSPVDNNYIMQGGTKHYLLDSGYHYLGWNWTE